MSMQADNTDTDGPEEKQERGKLLMHEEKASALVACTHLPHTYRPYAVTHALLMASWLAGSSLGTPASTKLHKLTRAHALIF